MPRTAKSKENASHQTKGAAKAASKSAKAAAPAPPPSAPPPALLTEAGLQRGADGSFLLADSFLFKQHVSRAQRRRRALVVLRAKMGRRVSFFREESV